MVPLLNSRGIDLISLSDINAQTSVKQSGTFISVADVKFDCMADQSFKNFLRQNKFQRAVLLKPKCEEFKIRTFFNSAVTIIETPFELENDTLLNTFYLHFFLECVLQNQPNLPQSWNISKASQSGPKLNHRCYCFNQWSYRSGKEVLSSLIHAFSIAVINLYCIKLRCNT